MTKISCDVCIDLLPLVKDSVASEDSRLLVNEHIQNCESCRRMYESQQTEIPVMNEQHVLSKMKNQLFIIAVGVVVFGALLGLALSDSVGMFYNILIMPTIGAVGYLCLNKKAYLLPVALFVLSYVWHFVKYSCEQIYDQSFPLSMVTMPLYWSIIYTILCAAGVVIAWLLRIAFGKERIHHD